jgi:hypothetical protein
LWDNSLWTKKAKETQTGASLLLIFCCCHRISDPLYNIEAAATMAKAEHPEKYNWWLNELDSLGISTLQKNGLNNQREASDLAEAVKQTLYEEYLQAYSESNR